MNKVFSKVKILYFVNYFPPSTGAAALNSLKIVEYLVKFGHELMIEEYESLRGVI